MSKPKTSAARPKRKVEPYTHPGKKRVNNPPVGADQVMFHVWREYVTGDDIFYDAHGEVVVDIRGNDIVTQQKALTQSRPHQDTPTCP